LATDLGWNVADSDDAATTTMKKTAEVIQEWTNSFVRVAPLTRITRVYVSIKSVYRDNSMIFINATGMPWR
jgi:hypothetical protein